METTPLVLLLMSNVRPPVGDNVNWERIMSRPPYHIASLDLNHIGSYTSHAHDFQSPDNIIMVRSTDERTIAQKNGPLPPKLKTVLVSTVETYNRNQNTVRKLTTKSVDGVLESKETVVTDANRTPLLGSQVNLKADKMRSPPSVVSTPLSYRSQMLPRRWRGSSPRPSLQSDSQKKREVKKDEFAKECLQRHNEYRDKHKVEHLKLSSELSAHAQEWADYLASILRMQHRPNNKYGENLYMYMTTDKTHMVRGGDAVDNWYKDEISKYKFGTEPRNLDAGHLTQVLWAGSTHLGVGVAMKGGHTFVVCNYNPPGNYKGEYADNVPPIGGWKGKQTITSKATSSPVASKEGFINDVLKIHNDYRAKHGVSSLSLDANLSKYAQSWAEHLAKKNLFSHRSQSPYGENLFWSSDSASAQVAIDSWYSEGEGYNYNTDPFRNGGSMKAGHFTQMVWKESKQIGVGRAFSKNGAMILVANYSPRGNIIGHFTENVLPPKRR